MNVVFLVHILLLLDHLLDLLHILLLNFNQIVHELISKRLPVRPLEVNHVPVYFPLDVLHFVLVVNALRRAAPDLIDRAPSLVGHKALELALTVRHHGLDVSLNILMIVMIRYVLKSFLAFFVN